MAKIHGIVFILVGLLFSLGSYFLNEWQSTSNLTAFIYIGYIFIAYGFAKLIIGYILKKDKNNNIKNNKQSSRLYSNSDAPDKNIKTKNRDLPEGYIGYCKKCGTPMRKINIYCHRCGLKQ